MQIAKSSASFVDSTRISLIIFPCSLVDLEKTLEELRIELAKSQQNGMFFVDPTPTISNQFWIIESGR